MQEIQDQITQKNIKNKNSDFLEVIIFDPSDLGRFGRNSALTLQLEELTVKIICF